MTSKQDLSFQKPLNAEWCDYDKSSFEINSEIVPQVDTEITLNISGNKVCDINCYIPEYEVSTLPYTSTSGLSDASIADSDLNSSGLSIEDTSKAYNNNLLEDTAEEMDLAEINPTIKSNLDCNQLLNLSPDTAATFNDDKFSSFDETIISSGDDKTDLIEDKDKTKVEVNNEDAFSEKRLNLDQCLDVSSLKPLDSSTPFFQIRKESLLKNAPSNTTQVHIDITKDVEATVVSSQLQLDVNSNLAARPSLDNLSADTAEKENSLCETNVPIKQVDEKHENKTSAIETAANFQQAATIVATTANASTATSASAQSQTKPKVVKFIRNISLKPIYKFDKVPIKQVTSSNQPTVHRIQSFPGQPTSIQTLNSGNNETSASKVTIKPKNILDLLKSAPGDKYKQIGDRIVLPYNKLSTAASSKDTIKVRTISPATQLNPQQRKPLVVTIKKGSQNPSNMFISPNLKKSMSSSSGSIIHRVSQINIVSKNNPSVIKRYTQSKTPLNVRSLNSFNSSQTQWKKSLPALNQPYTVKVSNQVSLCTNSTSIPLTSFGKKTWAIKKEIKSENIGIKSKIRNNFFYKSPIKGLHVNPTPNIDLMQSFKSSVNRPSPHQLFDVFDELTNLDWLNDEDKSLFREIRKLNPDDPGIGMSGDESDFDGVDLEKNKSNRSIITAYSKVYGSAYYSQTRPTDYQYNPNSKPPYSFSSLIFMAVEDSDEKKLPVKDIYTWVCKHFPYFRTAPSGWKNSIRHNLSLNRCFQKAENPYKEKETAKGALWCIDPAYRTNLVQALKRSPYYPYLHPVGFTSPEPLRNLADLLPGVTRELPKTAQSEAAKHLWDDPVMASAAFDLVSLKRSGKPACAVEDTNRLNWQKSFEGTLEKVLNKTPFKDLQRRDSVESIGSEKLVINDSITQEHTYSSSQPSTSSSAPNHRSESPNSDKSAPDAAYEFESVVTSSDEAVMGGDLYIDEVDLTEIGNEVEIMSNASSVDEQSQMLFDSGFASLKQFDMNQPPDKKDTNLTDSEVSVTPESPQRQVVKKMTKRRKVKEEVKMTGKPGRKKMTKGRVGRPRKSDLGIKKLSVGSRKRDSAVDESVSRSTLQKKPKKSSESDVDSEKKMRKSHYHTRSSGHRLLSPSQNKNRKKRSRIDEVSVDEKEVIPAAVFPSNTADESDHEMLDAANCLLSLSRTR